jgi:Icc-related predicted phosphoesterase
MIVKLNWPVSSDRGYSDKISIFGDFTDWLPIILDPTTGVEFDLSEGYHEYGFVINGIWYHDPKKPNILNTTQKSRCSRHNIIRVSDKIKIIHMSDNHNKYPRIDEYADIFIHTGDFSIRGKPEDYFAFNEWLDTLKIPYKIVVLGNHELLGHFKDDGVKAKQLLTNAIVLNTEEIMIENIRFFGVQWVEDDSHSYRSMGDDVNRWNNIPFGIDFLLTHQPPQTVLDNPPKHWGSITLLDAVKRSRPRYHLFGHVHQSYGNIESDLDGTGHKIKFYNSSLVDDFTGNIVNDCQIIYV